MIDPPTPDSIKVLQAIAAVERLTTPALDRLARTRDKAARLALLKELATLWENAAGVLRAYLEANKA